MRAILNERGEASTPVRFIASSSDDMSNRFRDHSVADIEKLKGKSALVVEDEYLVGLDLVQTLTDWGLKVTGPIQTLVDATAMSDAPWDFIILDVNLDGTDTLALARTLVGRGARIIFVTAYADYDSRFIGELSQVPRLGKPVPYRTLQRILTGALN